MVPLPNANLPGHSSIFTSLSERQHARQPLDFLNSELAKGPGRSNVAQNAEQEVKALLDSDDITDFRFKTPSRVQGRDRQAPATNGSTKTRPTFGVSTFADAMLRQTNLAHRYPTPISPNETSPTFAKSSSKKSPQKFSPTQTHKQHPKPTPSVSRQQPAIPQPNGASRFVELQPTSPLPSYTAQQVQHQAPVTPTPSRFVDNQVSYSLNENSAVNWSHQQSAAGTIDPRALEHQPATSEVAAIGVHIPTPKIPLPPQSNAVPPQTPEYSKLQPTVLIPPPSTDSRPPDFITYDLPAKLSDSSRKRKRDADTSGVSLQTKDQRAEADEAVRRLHEAVGDIFEADDELQPDPSGVQSSAYQQFFVAAFHEDSAVNTLAPSVLVRLETALQKVLTVGRLDDVPVDYLQRLQGLCVGAIASAESLDLQVDPNWSFDDAESWMQRLDGMDHGLRSARTVIRVMTGGREEKQLYSEELLQTVSRLVQKAVNCLVPVVEARSSGPPTALFDSATSHKKIISQVLHDTNRVLGLLVKLVGKEEMAEEVISPLEYCAIGLLFVENAPSEKESVLGIQKFETLRRSAMDMITIVYSRYPSQRSFLFMEILTSLQKLPTGRQAKRHFKLGDGKSIQIVSALIMQLVQTIATSSPSFKKPKRPTLATIGDDEDDSEALNEVDDESSVPRDSEESYGSEDDDDDNNAHQNIPIQRLAKVANGLCNSAATSASYAARYLVSRAQASSKTGDEPHRQLLDIFIEDLLTVLSMPDWPAAELLLRALFKSFADIIDDPKSLAPAKNMALELLGMIGSAISELVSITQHAAKGLENQDSELSGYLSQMVDNYTDGSLETSEVLTSNGPYHAVVDYLTPNNTDDLHGTSAHGYCLAQWAKAVSSANMKGPDNVKLARRLRTMLLRTGSLPFDSQDGISVAQSHVAYALTVLNMDLCRQFDYILKILLRSINTEATTVRSRALKSVTHMLEKDPSLLDRSRDFKLLIGQCTLDASSMVRDNALTLIAKCISLRPALESDFTPNVLSLANDPAVGVRKRTIKLLKDMYLRNSNKDVKAKIGDTLLQRAQDLDASVLELARQTFEDIWMSPFWAIPQLKDATAQNKIALREQINLIVRTAQRSADVRTVLENLLIQVLSDSSKNAIANLRVCKSLVATAFETIIDAEEDRGEQQQTLLTLTVFAKAKPKLFTSDQLQILQPYIGNLSSTDDLDFFRSIVIIFRCVLPELPAIQHELLRNIQTALLGSIQKLYKTELDEVAQCLWKLNTSLQNPEKLINLTKAVLNKLYAMRNDSFADPTQHDNLKRMKKYLWIVGAFGNHCDFEPYKDVFRRTLSWWNAEGDPSVADLIVQSVKPFTGKVQPMALRAEALESIGSVCQAWPRQFTKKHISNAFEDILHTGEPELQSVVLSSFRNFLHKIESQAAAKNPENSPGAETTVIKLGASATASEDDGASTLIAQFFLKDLLKVALASQGDTALIAAEVITSINCQGLAHPRASVSALVALETSTNPAIADVALYGHRILHQQHESALEQEYMRSVQDAFRYQRDIANDSLGYTMQPIAAKLKGSWEIIKTSVGKYQKKFLSNFCAKINFDITKMDLSGSPPNTLQFSRFLTENLAFFDYTRLDELLHTISCMEKIVANTGSGLAHSISTEIFHVTVEVEPETAAEMDAGIATAPQEQITTSDSQPPSASQPKIVDPARLYVLTTGSIILSILWEARTHLRRLYGQTSNQQRRENAKAKGAAKDLSKAPNRVQGVTGDKLISSITKMVASLDSQEAMMDQCQKFVDLMKIDDEVKVTGDSEDGSLDRPTTPVGDEDEDGDTPMSGSSRGHKRKSSVSLAGTPGKKKRGRPSLKRSKSSRKSFDGDDEEDGNWV